MRNFDLVVLDLDGTILNQYRREEISPVVQAAIAAVQARGVAVTIGTGRTLDYLRHHLPGALQFTLPAITTQGAVIGDPVTGKVLIEQNLPLAAARAVTAYVDAAGAGTALYFLDAEGHTYLACNRVGRDAEEQALLDHLLGASAQIVPALSPLLAAADAHPPIKVITYYRMDQGEPDFAAEYQRRFAQQLSITRTHDWLVEATAPGVDKGSGLLRLCALLDIDPARVLAIGDSDNDIPMLAAAGFGVAMGNASPA